MRVFKLKLRSTTLILIVELVATNAFAQTAQPGSITAAFAQFESAGNGAATNPNSTATGAYQDTIGFLQSAGIVAPGSANNVTSADFGNSNWSNITFQPNPYGITSRQDLLNAPLSVQTAIENAGLAQTYSQQVANGSTSYIGQTAPGGQVINQSALLACGEQLGAAGCKSYLQNGTTGNPATDASVQAEMQALSQTDSSAITGTPTLAVAQANGGSGSGGGNGSHAYMYCPPSISSALQQGSIANINAAVMLASNPSTGYSLADGSPINAGASLGGSQPDDFGVSSCLANLFSLQGLNGLFTVPNLSSILSHLVGMACSYAENVKSQMLAPLNESTFSNMVPTGFQPYIGSQGIGFSGAVGSGSNGQFGLGVSNGSQTQYVYSTSQTAGVGPSAPAAVNGVTGVNSSGAYIAAPLVEGGMTP